MFQLHAQLLLQPANLLQFMLLCLQLDLGGNILQPRLPEFFFCCFKSIPQKYLLPTDGVDQIASRKFCEVVGTNSMVGEGFL
ncbi:hypothetical protein AAHE18_13G377300 [Arachis hypogaea]